MTARTLGAAALCAAAGCVAYLALPPGFALRWDNVGHNLSLQREVHRQLQEGHLPLWNPYIWSGSPLLADPQSATFYPLARLVFAVKGSDLARVFDLQYAIHVALAGWFFFLYVSALGATTAAAVLGSAVYALNPHFMWLGTGFINWYSTLAWIPLVLLAVERLRAGAPAGRSLALGAGGFAMQLFAGFPQLSVYTALLVVPYALVRAWGAPSRRRWLVAGSGALVVVLGGCVAAVQLLPTAELWRASQRALAPGAFGRISIGWLGIAAAALPGVPAPPALANNGWTHVGLVPCLLALHALRRPDPLRLFLVLVAVVAAALSAGSWLFVLFEHLPLLGLLRGAVKFFPFVVFALAALGAIGLSDCERAGAPDRRLAWLLVAGLLASLGAGVLTVWRLQYVDAITVWDRATAALEAVVSAAFVSAMAVSAFRRRLRALVILAVVATCATMVLEARVYRREHGFTLSLLDMPASLIERFRQPLPPGGLPGRVMWSGAVGLFNRIELVNGYSAFVKRDYATATGWGQHGAWVPWSYAVDVLRGRNRTLDVLSVRYLGVPGHHASEVERTDGVRGAQRFRVVADADGLAVVENAQLLPRLYLAREVRRAPDQDAALALVATGAVDPRETPVVEDELPDLAGGRGGLEDGVGDVEVVSRAPGALRVRARSPDAALLVVSDAFDPGWRAALDGQPSRVVRVNGLAKGVVVPAGEHDVALYYWPASFVRGALVSAAALLLLLGIAAVAPRP